MLELEQIDGVGKATAMRLKNAGIANVETLAVTPAREVMEKAGYDKIISALRVVEAAREALGYKFMTAWEHWEMTKNRMKCTTGSTALNTLLGGGIETQAITELVGQYSSGKTQLCLMLCVTAQLKPENGGFEGNVLFFDTEGTFGSNRVYQIAAENGLDPGEALHNIIISRVYTSDHQMFLLDHAFEKCAEEKVKLVIVDSVISHFRGEFLGRETLADRQQKLNLYMHKLLRLAEIFNLAVVVTNQAQSDPTPQHGSYITDRPAGGNILAHACLHPETWVYAADGVTEVRNIHNPVCLLGAEQQLGKCTESWTTKPKEAILINEELLCSPEHILFKFEEGYSVLCRAGELKLGDWLLIPSKVNVKGRDITLPNFLIEYAYRIKNPSDIKKKLREKGIVLKRREYVSRLSITPRMLRNILNQGFPTTNRTIESIEKALGEKINVEKVATNKHSLVKIPKTLSEDVAQIFGYWLGDGDRGLYNNTIRIKEEREEVLKHYANLFFRTFNVKPRIIRYNNFYELKFANKYIALLFRWLMQNLTAISEITINVVRGFLRGFFDAEARGWEGSINLANKDKKLLLFIKMLLLRFGIISTLRKMKCGSFGKKRVAYMLNLNSHSVDKFAEQIMFTASDKQTRVKRAMKRRGWLNLKLISENLAIRRIDEMERVQTNDNFIDLTVKPTENFIANGYLVHNCNTRVWLRRGKNGASKRVAKVFDSPCLPEGECAFKITQKGIEDAEEEEKKD